MIKVDIQTRETVSPRMREMASQISPHRIALVAGRAISGLIRQHLFSLDRARANRLGGKRTHFYGQAARATQQPRPVSGGVVVEINHVGIRQRLEGGTIRPVRSKYLTIPAVPEAHGKRAREFNNLEFRPSRDGQTAALVETKATLVKFGKKGARSAGEVGGRVVYWLRKQVTQRPDPSVLPRRDEMVASATTATSQFITRVASRGKGGAA